MSFCFRPDIRLHVQRIPHDSTDHLSWILEELRNKGKDAKKTLVFCTSMSDAGKLYKWAMVRLGPSAFDGGEKTISHRLVDMYHAKVSEASERRVNTFAEPQSTIRLIFTTIKMGMGVDIQDIERVVIYGAPSSMVDLWQQVGRCARGAGMKGMGTIYLTGRTLQWADRDVKRLAATTGCYRKAMLEAFPLEDKSTSARCKEEGCKHCLCCNWCQEQCPQHKE